jgi:hypothetical protein
MCGARVGTACVSISRSVLIRAPTAATLITAISSFNCSSTLLPMFCEDVLKHRVILHCVVYLSH